jgi:DNA-binding NtrC family response regulator
VVKPIRADVLKETLRLALNASDGATVGLHGIALSNRMDQCSALSGDSDIIQELRDYVSEQVACNRPFLLVGSPSCGKREIAEFVHYNGNCAGGPCIFYDCAKHSEDEMYHTLIDSSGAFGFQIQHAEKGTLILAGVDQLSLGMQKIIASAYERILEHTRLILLSDSLLEDGLDRGTIDDEFYFKVGAQVFEVPERIC